MSIQLLERVIPSNPSDINFEIDFRSNTEQLLTSLKEFDSSFTDAVAALGGSTFTEGINTFKQSSDNQLVKIIDALEAENLTALSATKQWQWGSTAEDTATGLRFDGLQERFAYLDSSISTVSTTSSALVDDIKFNLLQENLTYTQRQAKLINGIFFVRISGATQPYHNKYVMVIDVANHGLTNGEYFLLDRSSSAALTYETDDITARRFYLEKVNGSSRFFFVRKIPLSATSSSTYITIDDCGLIPADLLTQSGSTYTDFTTVFSGIYSSSQYIPSEYLDVNNEVSFPSYEIVNIFNEPSERSYESEKRISDLETISNQITQATTLYSPSYSTLNLRLDTYATKTLLDSELVERDAKISTLEGRVLVPSFTTDGTDEGKILQISGDSASWQTPAQVDTSTAYSWIPDVAFQTIQFDGEVLTSRELAAGYIYYVAGDLVIANDAILTLASSPTVNGAILIIQGHLIGNPNNVVINVNNVNRGGLRINNWKSDRSEYVIRKGTTIRTSEINLSGTHLYDADLVLEPLGNLEIDTELDITFRSLIWRFLNNDGSHTDYFDFTTIPALLIPDIGGYTIDPIYSTLSTIQFNNVYNKLKYFSVTETTNERIFSLEG
jgi:hypothetical protein